MQCPSCQFRNMPGVAICSRCGANLRLESLEIDVNPPRAADRNFWQRNLPHFTLHGGRYWPRFRDFLTQTRISIFGEWDVPDVDPEPVMRRLIIPGWPQIYCGNVRRGQLFLGLYLLFLCLGLLWMGSFLGNQMLGLAVACHISSVLDMALMGERQLFNRIKRSVTWGFIILIAIYIPAFMLITQVLSPNVVQARMPPFETGDVLLINQWNTPDPGDIVLYDIPPMRIDARANLGFAGILQIQGLRIDRILAGPGQRVVTKEGKLFVDGALSDLYPCNRERPLPELDVTVPANSYLILPSSDPNIPTQNMPQVAIVESQRITGRVFFRNLPYSRFGFVR